MFTSPILLSLLNGSESPATALMAIKQSAAVAKGSQNVHKVVHCQESWWEGLCLPTPAIMGVATRQSR